MALWLALLQEGLHALSRQLIRPLVPMSWRKHYYRAQDWMFKRQLLKATVSGITPGAMIDLSTKINTTGQGGIVFDYQGSAYYKFVTLNVATHQIAGAYEW